MFNIHLQGVFCILIVSCTKMDNDSNQQGWEQLNLPDENVLIDWDDVLADDVHLPVMSSTSNFEDLMNDAMQSDEEGTASVKPPQALNPDQGSSHDGKVLVTEQKKVQRKKWDLTNTNSGKVKMLAKIFDKSSSITDVSTDVEEAQDSKEDPVALSGKGKHARRTVSFSKSDAGALASRNQYGTKKSHSDGSKDVQKKVSPMRFGLTRTASGSIPSDIVTASAQETTRKLGFRRSNSASLLPHRRSFLSPFSYFNPEKSEVSFKLGDDDSSDEDVA